MPADASSAGLKDSQEFASGWLTGRSPKHILTSPDAGPKPGVPPCEALQLRIPSPRREPLLWFLRNGEGHARRAVCSLKIWLVSCDPSFLRASRLVRGDQQIAGSPVAVGLPAAHRGSLRSDRFGFIDRFAVSAAGRTGTFLKGLILAQNERWRRGLGMQVERRASFGELRSGKRGSKA